MRVLVVHFLCWAVALAQVPGDAEWKARLNLSWKRTHEAHPESQDRSGELYQEILKVDKWAKVNDRQLYENPEKVYLIATSIAPRLAEKRRAEALRYAALLESARRVRLEDFLSQGGGKRLDGSKSKGGYRYTEGAIKGMTEQQAISLFNQKWMGLSEAGKRKQVEQYLALLAPSERKKFLNGESTTPVIWRMFVRNSYFEEANRAAINRERAWLGLPKLPPKGRDSSVIPVAISSTPASILVSPLGDGLDPIVFDRRLSNGVIDGQVRFHGRNVNGRWVFEPVGGGGNMELDFEAGLLFLR